MAITPFTMTLAQVETLGPGLRHFIFTVDAVDWSFIPGQFITVHFEHSGKMLRRSYSIATVPGQGEHIEFAAGYVEDGPGTQFLFNLKPGDPVQTTGPFGRLVLRDEHPKRYILVATSTGVTPYRSMLPEISRRLQTTPLEVIVLQGVRDRASLLYGEEFAGFAEQHPRFTFRAHYSRDFPQDAHPHEQQGYVQHAFAELNLDPEADIVYLCGNPGMVDEAFAALKEADFAIQNIRREKYVSAK